VCVCVCVCVCVWFDRQTTALPSRSRCAPSNARAGTPLVGASRFACFEEGALFRQHLLLSLSLKLEPNEPSMTGAVSVIVCSVPLMAVIYGLL